MASGCRSPFQPLHQPSQSLIAQSLGNPFPAESALFVRLVVSSWWQCRAPLIVHDNCNGSNPSVDLSGAMQNGKFSRDLLDYLDRLRDREDVPLAQKVVQRADIRQMRKCNHSEFRFCCKRKSLPREDAWRIALLDECPLHRFPVAPFYNSPVLNVTRLQSPG